MSTIDWLAVLRKAASDIAANAPPPAGAPFAVADLAPLLEDLQTRLPAIVAAVRAHQGAITGVGDILDALRAAGATWAGELESALYATHGLLAAAEAWLPTIVGALRAFAPEPVDSPVSPRDPTQFSRGGH